MHGDCGQERGKLIQVAPSSLVRLPWSELPEIHGVAWLLSCLVTSVILDYQHLQEMFVSMWERKWIYISHVLLRGPPCTCDNLGRGKWAGFSAWGWLSEITDWELPLNQLLQTSEKFYPQRTQQNAHPCRWPLTVVFCLSCVSPFHLGLTSSWSRSFYQPWNKMGSVFGMDMALMKSGFILCILFKQQTHEESMRFLCFRLYTGLILELCCF